MQAILASSLSLDTPPPKKFWIIFGRIRVQEKNRDFNRRWEKIDADFTGTKIQDDENGAVKGLKG